MTNDKPKREDAPIAWRVSDEEIIERLRYGVGTSDRERLALLDLKAARAALDRCSDFAATLGHENDELRERVQILEEVVGAGSELRARFKDYKWTVEDCRTKGMQWCHICPEFQCGDNMNPGRESGGGVAGTPTNQEQRLNPSGAIDRRLSDLTPKRYELTDRPAASDYSTPAQILVRGGKPDIFRGAWIASLTPEHPLWLVWKRASRGDACVSADGMPDGLYTVVDCEACKKRGPCWITDFVDCPTCSGTGQTLRRESEATND